MISFDPLKWLDDFVQEMIHGRGVEITWLAGGEFSGAEGETLLRGYGVKGWSRRYAREDGDNYGLRVSPGQAAYADALLRVAGYAITSPHLGKKFKVLPEAWEKPVKNSGLAGMIGNILDAPDYAALEKQRSRQIDRERKQR